MGARGLAPPIGPCYLSRVFGLGLWEIGVVVLLAVMLFPPKELPKLARSIARTYGSIRRTAEDFRNQIMEDEDLRAPIDEVRSAYNDARWQLKKAEAAARRELQKAEMEARRAADLAKGDKPDHDEDDDEDDEDEEGDDADSAAVAIAVSAEDELDPEEEHAHGGEQLKPETQELPDEPTPDRVPASPPRSFVPPPPVMKVAKAQEDAASDKEAEPSVA